ncbi:endonuclease [Clostridium sp. AF19-22AC]|jgi:putative phage-type endonuclease|uniref:YqaJ viral recombinase family nuclease n=1 Tax=Clostridia TaxID=186801 RepID=UPI000E4C6DEA|nr:MULTISPECIES: YqaJ viral recombinase family protein [Clostridia]RHR27098.1 endonuclease [Clostridium sp. AF19-22AC]
MKKLISTLDLDKQDWLSYRKLGIGGSDAGAVCGFNPYRTAMQVYQDKISEETEDIDNEAMRQGREFEDYVARRFMEATGKKVRRANAMYYDEERPFMLADVDRIVTGENAGLECKTASPYMADKWADGKIPMSYQIQCYHYMSVCNAEAWYIAVLIYGRELKYYRIERDEQLIAYLRQLEQDFWENHVLKRVMPEPDGSKLADSVILEYFRDSVPVSINLSGFDEKLKRRQELLDVMERMDAERKKIEQELKLYLGEAEVAENERYRVSWKQVCSNRLDEKRLKEEQPEVYEKYRKEIVSRRFTVKAA